MNNGIGEKHYSVNEFIAMKKLQKQARTCISSIDRLIGFYDIDSFHNTKFLRSEALYDALRFGMKEIIDIIIGSPEYLTNFRGGNGITSIHIAAYKGYDKVVSVLLTKILEIPVDAENNDPMHYAVMGFSVTVVMCLKPIISPAVNNEGFTPFHIANIWLTEKNLTENERRALESIRRICMF